MTYNGKELKDRILICCDCENEFVFTAGQQEFFLKHSLTAPKRCKRCKLLKTIKNAPEIEVDKL